MYARHCGSWPSCRYVAGCVCFGDGFRGVSAERKLHCTVHPDMYIYVYIYIYMYIYFQQPTVQIPLLQNIKCSTVKIK